VRPATKDRLARVVTTAHMAVYRLSGGRVAGRLAGMPVLLLSTRGRTSGRSPTVPLTYFTDGDAIVLVASYGGDDRHPGWYRNLRCDPQVQVTQGRRRRTLRARDATAEERDRLWPRMTATYPGYARYQERTSRPIPVVVLGGPAPPPTLPAMAATGAWWWCRYHERVEGADTRCPPEDLLGPYESEADARNWKERVETRNERWEAEDRAWSGDEED